MKFSAACILVLSSLPAYCSGNSSAPCFCMGSGSTLIQCPTLNYPDCYAGGDGNSYYCENSVSGALFKGAPFCPGVSLSSEPGPTVGCICPGPFGARIQCSNPPLSSYCKDNGDGNSYYCEYTIPGNPKSQSAPRCRGVAAFLSGSDDGSEAVSEAASNTNLDEGSAESSPSGSVEASEAASEGSDEGSEVSSEAVSEAASNTNLEEGSAESSPSGSVEGSESSQYASFSGPLCQCPPSPYELFKCNDSFGTPPSSECGISFDGSYYTCENRETGDAFAAACYIPQCSCSVGVLTPCTEASPKSDLRDLCRTAPDTLEFYCLFADVPSKSVAPTCSGDEGSEAGSDEGSDEGSEAASEAASNTTLEEGSAESSPSGSVEGSEAASDGGSAESSAPPTLKDRWAIRYGSTTYDEDKSSGKYVFTSDFTFSDYINKTGVSYRLYDGPNCGDGDGESTVQNSGAKYLESIIDITSALSARTVTIKSTVDPTKLPGSPIFDGSTVGKAVVAWCLRVMASTTGSIAKEVNFNELVYTVDVDLTAGFNVTNLSVKKRDADQASQNVSYDVDACECDGSDCVTQNERREQGSIVTVCVKPKPRATAAGVYMRSIKKFTWERDNVSQPAIAENKEADNLLTSYSDCQGKSMCFFTSILFADFYKTEGVVNGSGEAILQFGSAKSRKLRSLQEDAEVASIADFDLNFAVNPSLDGANASGSPAGSMLFATCVAAAGTWMVM